VSTQKKQRKGKERNETMTGDLYLIIGFPNSGRTTLLRQLAPDAIVMDPNEIKRQSEGVRPLFGSGKEIKRCTVCIDDANEYVSDGTIERIADDARELGDVYVILRASTEVRLKTKIWNQCKQIYCTTDLASDYVPVEDKHRVVVHDHRGLFRKTYLVPSVSYDVFEEAVREDLKEMIVGKRAAITVECRYACE
jgi:hypothetical protein